MNFELGGHIVRKTELKKKKEKRPYNLEGRTKEEIRKATYLRSNQQASTKQSAKELQSEGCEDGRLCGGQCWAGHSMQRTDYSLMATKKDGYTEGRTRQNISPSTQRTDCSLSAMKTYGNIESHVGCKGDSWEATDGSTKGCN